MAIKENISLKKNPITGVLGIILTLVGIALYVIPYFYVPKSDPNMWVPAAIAATGLILLLSPDELVSIIKKKAE